MKSKREPGRTKKAEDGAVAGEGQVAEGAGAGGDGRIPEGAAVGGESQDAKGAGDGLGGQVVKGAGADRGGQPEGTETGEDRVIHNGSAGAFEAAEDGRYEEDSDEDNDDLAMGRY